MKPKHIIPLIWIAAGGLMCAFLLRLGEVDRLALSQIFLFYGSFAVADAALVTQTIMNRRENVSKTNFGFKLMGEAVILLLLLVFMLKDIFFT